MNFPSHALPGLGEGEIIGILDVQ
jgi:hypothetical protein